MLLQYDNRNDSETEAREYTESKSSDSIIDMKNED